MIYLINIYVNELDEEAITLDATIESEESIGLSNSADSTDRLSENENSEPGSFAELATELEGKSDGETVKLEKNYQYNNETNNQLIDGIELNFRQLLRSWGFSIF